MQLVRRIARSQVSRIFNMEGLVNMAPFYNKSVKADRVEKTSMST